MLKYISLLLPREKYTYCSPSPPCSSLSSETQRNGKNLLTQVCQSKFGEKFAYSTREGSRFETETKLLPRRIFGEGTTSRLEIDSISRLSLVVGEGGDEDISTYRILHHAWIRSKAKWSFRVLFIRNRFRDLKLIVQVTRSVNYRSIIHRVPDYDPKEWARDVWCFRKHSSWTRSSVFQTRSFPSLPTPSPLFSKHHSETRIRSPYFASGIRESIRRIFNRWHRKARDIQLLRIHTCYMYNESTSFN